MGQRGLRVLALARRSIPANTDRESWDQGLTLCGLVGLEDPLRPEVPDAVRCCHEAGIRVIMITGDHPQTAKSIARQAGLVIQDTSSVVTGDRLRKLTDAQLRLLLRNTELIFARVGADQKLRIVEALRTRREVVAVTGDGVNDAPALRAADIGIAMGRTGTDVARAAADLVLLDDNFATIVCAIEEGRGVYANIRKFLTYILSSNVPELIPYLAFVLFKIPLALTVIQILAVDLGTDLVPALGLGAEPPETGMMKQPPRPRRERLLTPWRHFSLFSF
jgi:magnesium-transporting ATPase (P-type)